MNAGDGSGETQKDAIRLSADTWADGAISSTSKEQWFTFTATSGTQYIHTKFGTTDRLYIQLYNDDNDALGDATTLYNSGYKSITVASGKTYYIKVTSSSSGGTYRIGFNAMPLPCGTLAGATTLSAGKWTDGVITPANGEQWFRFTATAGTQYLHVVFGTLTSLYVQLFDSSGGTLGGESHLNSYYGNEKSLLVTSGQVYYIKVTPYSSSGGTYQIAFNTSTTPPASN